MISPSPAAVTLPARKIIPKQRFAATLATGDAWHKVEKRQNIVMPTIPKPLLTLRMLLVYVSALCQACESLVDPVG